MPWITGAAIVGSSLLGSSASRSAGNAQASAADRAAQAQLDMFDMTQANLTPWMRSGRLSLNELNRLMGMPGAEMPRTGTSDRTMGSNIARDEFDADAYLRQNPDVAAARVDPWRHFSTYGRFEDRRLGFNPETRPGSGGDVSTGLPTGYLTRPFDLEAFEESPAFKFNLEQGQKAIQKAAAKNRTFYSPATLQDIGRFSQGLASNEFQNAFSNYNTNLNNIWSRLYAMSGSGQNAAANLGAFGTAVAGQVGDNITGAGAARAAGQMGAANAIAGGVGQGVNAMFMNQLLQQNQRSSVPLRSIPNLNGAGDLNLNFA